MKVLVTGGAGFVGSDTVDMLLEGGHEVIVVDNLDPQVHGQADAFPANLAHHATNARLCFLRGDVRDRSTLAAPLAGVEGVIHLAAAVGVGQSMYQPSHYCSVNVEGTAQLLDILANEQTSVRKVVIASSMSIYGEGSYWCEACGAVYPVCRNAKDLASAQWEVRCPSCGRFVKPIATREDKPLAPASIYAISKKTQEDLVLCFGRAYKLPVVALRYFNIYGPRQSLGNPYTGVVAIFISRLLNKKPPLIFEDGLQSRDFVHVHDIAKANLLALTSSGADFCAVNLGSGTAATVFDILERLSKILGTSVEPRIVGKFRAGDIRHSFADTSQARSLLGWEPAIKLEEGLKELVQWCIDSPHEAKRDLVDFSYSELKQRGLVE